MEDNHQGEGTDGFGTDESGIRANEPKSCACCSAEIDLSDWHPLVTRTDDDGTFHVYAFCSDDCKAEWLNADATGTDGDG